MRKPERTIEMYMKSATRAAILETLTGKNIDEIVLDFFKLAYEEGKIDELKEMSGKFN